jgi:hypothetical protein
MSGVLRRSHLLWDEMGARWVRMYTSSHRLRLLQNYLQFCSALNFMSFLRHMNLCRFLKVFEGLPGKRTIRSRPGRNVFHGFQKDSKILEITGIHGHAYHVACLCRTSYVRSTLVEPYLQEVMEPT